MRPLKLGTKVRTHVHHAAMPKGSRGLVTSVHRGLFYGVATAGGIAYIPAFHADPPGTPEPDQDESGNGMVDPDDSPGTGGSGSSGSSGSGGGAGGSSSGGAAAGS